MSITIYNADCRSLATWVPQFDAMITDPPYRAHVHKNATSQSKVRGTRKRDLGFDYLDPTLRRYVGWCAANVKKWSVAYSDVESINWLRISAQATGATYIRSIPWVRWSMPQLSGDRPPTGCEFIVCFWGAQRGAKHWNGPGNLTHLAHKCLRGEGKHKAEKPLDQCLDLVNWFSDPGDTVFDPFVGSGTIGVACAILDRSYVGCELNPEWAAKANERIALAKQGKLSDRDKERAERWLTTDHTPTYKQISP